MLDTNIISEVRKGTRCDAHVTRWYAALTSDAIYLSVLVLGEIRKGIEQARPRDPDKALALEHWLQAVYERFSGRILPVDLVIADEWGRMNAARTLSVIDGLLAATAKVHDLTLATRNIADVKDVGARIVNPFDPQTWE
ncbi:MAG: type II toxin-antitoxin system VapC family toxin [Desulfurellaceae bacterium]|nr:type II toxin-antitoxin system VapC family toxin [Desulfurellaceae bacterium]